MSTPSFRGASPERANLSTLDSLDVAESASGQSNAKNPLELSPKRNAHHMSFHEVWGSDLSRAESLTDLISAIPSTYRDEAKSVVLAAYRDAEAHARLCETVNSLTAQKSDHPLVAVYRTPSLQLPSSLGASFIANCQAEIQAVTTEHRSQLAMCLAEKYAQAANILGERLSEKAFRDAASAAVLTCDTSYQSWTSTIQISKDSGGDGDMGTGSTSWEEIPGELSETRQAFSEYMSIFFIPLACARAVQLARVTLRHKKAIKDKKAALRQEAENKKAVAPATSELEKAVQRAVARVMKSRTSQGSGSRGGRGNKKSTTAGVSKKQKKSNRSAAVSSQKTTTKRFKRANANGKRNSS